MKKNWYTELSKPSIVLIVGIVCFVTITMDGWRTWRKGESNFAWDIANYYSYLPAFVSNNASFEFPHDPASSFLNDYLPRCPTDNLHIPKTTYGMSLLYSPYYALGYKIAINQNDPRDGFSEPFATAVHWGMIFYGIIGLLLLRNFLVKFFSEKVTTVTLLVLFFGTSLFYYSLAQPEMAHCGLFFLFSAFMLVTYHWYQKQTLFRSVLIGLLIGLISLIRPTDLMIVFFFIFWPMASIFNFKERIQFFLRNYKHVIVMIISAFLMWLPQMLFWKARTGHLLYFSYPGEQFFWTDPQIMNVLFSYRKGLFVYTPLITLAFFGFFIKDEKLKGLKRIALVLTLLNLYLVSCWWDWFFGGCFAARSFVQHFAYLSIPLAVFIAYLFEKIKVNLVSSLVQLTIVIVISLGISLNLFQTYQYNNFMIHPNCMTKKTYWGVFGKFKLSESDQSNFWNSIKEPNYDKLRSGEDRDQ